MDGLGAGFRRYIFPVVTGGVDVESAGVALAMVGTGAIALLEIFAVLSETAARITATVPAMAFGLIWVLITKILIITIAKATVAQNIPC